MDYAEKVSTELKKYDIRCLIDRRNEKVGRKIRDAEVDKIPYMAVIGEKEIEEQAVSVRRHGKGDIGMMPLNQFVDQVVLENN